MTSDPDFSSTLYKSKQQKLTLMSLMSEENKWRESLSPDANLRLAPPPRGLRVTLAQKMSHRKQKMWSAPKPKLTSTGTTVD